MGFSMISDVGNLLIDILSRELVPDVILHGSEIGLCSPDDHGDYRLGLYLYDINLSEEMTVSGKVSTGLKTQIYPSTFLSLDYMITAYSSSDLKFRAEEEHKILGRVVQVLGDHRLLSERELGLGASMGAKILLQRMDQYEKMRLWTFPNEPYKLSLFYRIEPVEITSSKTFSITRVRDVEMLIDEDRVFFDTSLVVLPVDDFTGRPITGSNVQIAIPGARPAVVKEDGYRVFTNVTERVVTLQCRSGLYENRKETIDLQSRDPDDILVLRLAPSGNYPIPSGTTCISGRTTPGRRLLFWDGKGKKYKLSKDYKHDEDGTVLSLYQPDDLEFDGKSFFFMEKEKRGEYFKITGKGEKGYRISRSLKKDHKKVGTELLPVLEVQADEKGNFFLPVPGEQTGSIDLSCLAGEGEAFPDPETAKEQVFSLEEGKVNMIQLEEV